MRRTRHLAFAEVDEGETGRVGVRSFLTGKVETLSLAELGLLLGVSARAWTWRADDEAMSLAVCGLFVSDEPEEPFVSLRQRDIELTALGWHPAAAAFHLATWWDGHRVSVPGRDGSPPERGRRVGAPEPPFHERGGDRVPLSRVEPADELHRLLLARRTARTFATRTPVSSEQLATLLHSTWGAHATAPLALGDTALRKTSPSGGGLHPIEVYPIVRSVDGVEPGLYHYRVGDHELERLASLDAEECAGLLERMTAGQWWFASADVGFVMTARFARSFWKYRHHAKALRVLHLDAGHLGQTFYLVCTQLGLGPFVTAAIDEGEITRTLGLDPLFEAPLVLCGCGRTPESRSRRLDPDFRPLSERQVRG
jgi:putative peptide maturation dehydrogenase